jgi:SAM-dependent methyltransferase
MFSFAAPWYARLYRLFGLDRGQRRMLDAAQGLGCEGASVLDIGCGVGALHQELLHRGARRAVGVDLSEQMLKQARGLARRRGIEAQTHYVQGDFVDLEPILEEADITLLDRAVCCYPDADALVNRSLERTRRIYALTYPRDHWFNRASVSVMGWALQQMGSDYRAFVHSPRRIEAWIAAKGFHKHMEHRSPLWLTQVYAR